MSSQTNYTYSQLINIFNAFAVEHKQINSFQYGQSYEFASSGDILYPALWVTPQPGTIKGNQIALKFYVIVADLAAQDLTDTLKVHSNTLQIALDFKTFMQRAFLFDIEVDETNVTITPFVELSGDNLAGWNMNLTILLDNYSDFCTVTDLLRN